MTGTIGKIKILVVEDETAVAMMMVFLLNRAGCDVQTAWNAEKALRLISEHDFDLIVLEIDLPGTCGFNLCRSIKRNRRFSATPLIFISRHSCEKERHRAVALGAVDYIVKPFDGRDFIERTLSHVCKAQKLSDFPNQNAHSHPQSLCDAAQRNQ